MDKALPEKGVWYYNPSKKLRRKCIFSRYKYFLYIVLYRGTTRHNLMECFWLLKLLPKCTTIECYVVYRYIMIMINTLKSERINKNFIIYLESLLSKLTVSKPDIFVEFISYFMRNQRIDDAHELYNQRLRFMSYLYHRNVPLSDVNIRCYGLLLNYLEWKKRLPTENEIEFDVSIQGWLVNGMDPLKSTDHNYEIFVMCIVDVLMYYGFWKKVYLFVSEFQRSNPDNLAAQLLLYKLIERLTSRNRAKRRKRIPDHVDPISNEEEQFREQRRATELSAINNFSLEECGVLARSDEYPFVTDKKNILDRLQRLDPICDELIELSYTYLEKTESIKLIMDSLEHVSKIKDPHRWRCLQDNLNEVIGSNNPILVNKVTILWQTRYKRFWCPDHFVSLAADGERGDKVKHHRIIRGVFQTLASNFDRQAE